MLLIRLCKCFFCSEEFPAIDVKLTADALHLDETSLLALLSFWKLRRRQNFDKPLVESTADRTQSDSDSEGAGDGIADRDKERLKFFLHLRQDLERVSVSLFASVERVFLFPSVIFCWKKD